MKSHILLFLILVSPWLSAQTNFTSALLKMSEFKKLSSGQQTDYVRALQAAYVEFEEGVFDQDNLSELVQQSPLPSSKWVQFINQLQPSALADNTSTNCVVGGVLLSRVDRGGRSICPATGRSCQISNSNDNFKCGNIFNEVCVTRLPLDGLSKRCQTAANNRLPQYGKIKSELEKLETFCQSINSGSQGCGYLQQRITLIKEQVYGSDSQFCAGNSDLNQQVRLIQCGNNSNLKPDARDIKRMVAKIMSCNHSSCNPAPATGFQLASRGGRGSVSKDQVSIEMKQDHILINGKKVNFPATLSKIGEALNCDLRVIKQTPTITESSDAAK